MTYFLKTKKETVDRLEAYLKYIQTLFLQPSGIAALHTDAGTEFTNTKVKRLLKDWGITLELVETEVHQHNGTAERFNGTHQDKIRALLFDSGFSNTIWGWASDATMYIYNWLLHSANDDYTSYERFHGKRPNVIYLPTFGALVQTHATPTN